VVEKLNAEAAMKMEFEKISIDEKKFRYPDRTLSTNHSANATLY